MKTIINYLSRAALVFSGLFFSLVNFAQDKKEVDININTKDNNWYAQPWVWVIGAAVFVLLIVALTRGNRAKE